MRGSGVRAAGIAELIAVCFARRQADAVQGLEMSRKLLARFQRLQALGEASHSDISEITGLEDFEVLRAQALIELGRRIALAKRGDVTHIESLVDVEHTLDYLRFEKKEHFIAILLDAKNAILRVATIHIGTLTSSLVGPREVFREAIREGASAIIVAHNHPSGNPEPSPEDLEVTRQLVQIGRLLDIPVLDHVIIGERRSVSLQARGQIAG
jgi:DNA repair protein RadC